MEIEGVNSPREEVANDEIVPSDYSKVETSPVPDVEQSHDGETVEKVASIQQDDEPPQEEDQIAPLDEAIDELVENEKIEEEAHEDDAIAPSSVSEDVMVSGVPAELVENKPSEAIEEEKFVTSAENEELEEEELITSAENQENQESVVLDDVAPVTTDYLDQDVADGKADQLTVDERPIELPLDEQPELFGASPHQEQPEQEEQPEVLNTDPVVEDDSASQADANRSDQPEQAEGTTHQDTSEVEIVVIQDEVDEYMEVDGADTYEVDEEFVGEEVVNEDLEVDELDSYVIEEVDGGSQAPTETVVADVPAVTDTQSSEELPTAKEAPAETQPDLETADEINNESPEAVAQIDDVLVVPETAEAAEQAPVEIDQAPVEENVAAQAPIGEDVDEHAPVEEAIDELEVDEDGMDEDYEDLPTMSVESDLDLMPLEDFAIYPNTFIGSSALYPSSDDYDRPILPGDEMEVDVDQIMEVDDTIIHGSADETSQGPEMPPVETVEAPEIDEGMDYDYPAEETHEENIEPESHIVSNEDEEMREEETEEETEDAQPAEIVNPNPAINDEEATTAVQVEAPSLPASPTASEPLGEGDILQYPDEIIPPETESADIDEQVFAENVEENVVAQVAGEEAENEEEDPSDNEPGPPLQRDFEENLAEPDAVQNLDEGHREQINEKEVDLAADEENSTLEGEIAIVQSDIDLLTVPASESSVEEPETAAQEQIEVSTKQATVDEDDTLGIPESEPIPSGASHEAEKQSELPTGDISVPVLEEAIGTVDSEETEPAQAVEPNPVLVEETKVPLDLSDSSHEDVPTATPSDDYDLDDEDADGDGEVDEEFLKSASEPDLDIILFSTPKPKEDGKSSQIQSPHAIEEVHDQDPVDADDDFAMLDYELSYPEDTGSSDVAVQVVRR